MIEIIPYQPRWPAEFQELGTEIRRVAGDAALRIDHIGSTSVPDLASKDILDIMMTVAGFEALGQMLPGLESLGFVQREYKRDHPPAWDRSPPEQWEKRYLGRRDPYRRVNFHVRIAGRANQRYALLFRDYLRATPEAAAAYAALKFRACEISWGYGRSRSVCGDQGPRLRPDHGGSGGLG